MEHHVGIDVSLELSSLCVLDATGKVIREAKVASEPEALVAFLRDLGVTIVRVGLEAGPLSQWLYDGLHRAGFDAVLLETSPRQGGPVGHGDQVDRRDARGIAQRYCGWDGIDPLTANQSPRKKCGLCWLPASRCRSSAMDLEQTLRGCCSAASGSRSVM